MPTDVSFVNVRKSFQAVAGLESMTETDHFFFEQSLNRAAQRAYDASNNWPRFLEIGEKRPLGSLIVKGTQLSVSSANSYDDADQLNGGYENLGDDSNGNPVYFPMNMKYRVIWVLRKEIVSNRWEFKAVQNMPTIDSDGVVSYTVISGAPIIFQDRNFGAGTDEVSYDHPWEVKVWNTDTIYTLSNYPIVEQRNIIPYESTFFRSAYNQGQESRESVDQFIRLHKSQPLLDNSCLEYDFYTDSDGANAVNIANTSDTNIYATYKKKLPTFSETSTNIPGEFHDFIIYSVLADFYTGDGQTEKALSAEATAKRMLDKELFELDIKSNINVVTHKFTTYVNRQSR